MRVLMLRDGEHYIAVGLEEFLAVQGSNIEETAGRFTVVHAGMMLLRSEKKKKKWEPLEPAPAYYQRAWDDEEARNVVRRYEVSIDKGLTTWTEV